MILTIYCLQENKWQVTYGIETYLSSENIGKGSRFVRSLLMTAVSFLKIIMAKVSGEITFKVLTWRDFKYERVRLKCTYHRGSAHQKRLFSACEWSTPTGQTRILVVWNNGNQRTFFISLHSSFIFKSILVIHHIIIKRNFLIDCPLPQTFC